MKTWKNIEKHGKTWKNMKNRKNMEKTFILMRLSFLLVSVISIFLTFSDKELCLNSNKSCYI